MDSKFNYGSYGPNTRTAQIWVGRDSIEFLEKSNQSLRESRKTLNIEVIVDKLNFLDGKNLHVPISVAQVMASRSQV